LLKSTAINITDGSMLNYRKMADMIRCLWVAAWCNG